MKITLLALLCLSSIAISYGDLGRSRKSLSEEDDLELERQLKILNKPAVKTFRTDYGAIVDCVDIEKQPAFDHHLLKNHKLQMEPRNLPHPSKNDDSFEDGRSNAIFESQECPSGTVPIRRTTKEDLMRSKAITNDFANFVTHNAVIKLDPFADDGVMHGGSGTISTCRPLCQDEGQRSLSAIWISNGVNDQLTNIMVGWTVNPSLYNDNQTHLFISWTTDNGVSTGCIDLRCPGFVQVDSSFVVGSVLQPTMELPVSVYQDDTTKNWWLMLWSSAEKLIQVGYWPNEILPLLSGGATVIYFGGSVGAAAGIRSPEMGSGLFPDTSVGTPAYISQITFLDKSNTVLHPSQTTQVSKKVDKPDCYNLDDLGYQDPKTGYIIFFGGPGGIC